MTYCWIQARAARQRTQIDCARLVLDRSVTLRELFNGQSTMEGYIEFCKAIAEVKEHFFVDTLLKYTWNSIHPSMISKYILMYISLEIC